MNELLAQLQRFSATEEFFDFLGLPYDAAVLHVHRLHIMKRFHQYLAQQPVTDDPDPGAAQASCRALLARAYDDFVNSTAAREKVFKVFQDQAGAQSVSIDKLRAALPSAQG